MLIRNRMYLLPATCYLLPLGDMEANGMKGDARGNECLTKHLHLLMSEDG